MSRFRSEIPGTGPGLMPYARSHRADARSAAAAAVFSWLLAAMTAVLALTLATQHW